MFKQSTLYRVKFATEPTSAQISEALAAEAFVECGATQTKSVGWVPPRGEAHAPLCESVDGQWITKLMIETRTVPSAALNQEVKARVAATEAETGRKPGRKETRDIRDDAFHDLLPHAFSKQRAVLAWINPKSGITLIDSVNKSHTDEVITSLVKAIQGINVRLVQTTVSATAAMAEWLRTGETPPGLTVMRMCELKACDESKAVVRYARHSLDTDEVRQHIAAGKLPTKLALNWDDRVNFVLTEDFQIKSIAFEDVVFEGAAEKDSASFDCDAAIATGELNKLIPDLIASLGGELG